MTILAVLITTRTEAGVRAAWYSHITAEIGRSRRGNRPKSGETEGQYCELQKQSFGIHGFFFFAFLRKEFTRYLDSVSESQNVSKRLWKNRTEITSTRLRMYSGSK